MDKVKTVFDKWAKNGRAELMEREHGKNVRKFLSTIKFKENFSFLDVGCGNGWVVRLVANNPKARKVVGIDTSKNMILMAKTKKHNDKEFYHHAKLETWKNKTKFDYVFSMESLYYVKSLDVALEIIYKMLKSDGIFFCGTDFYKENVATNRWSEKMKIPMHLLSKNEWKKILEKHRFEVKTRQIKETSSRKKWKREHGTLFIIGKKCDK